VKARESVSFNCEITPVLCFFIPSCPNEYYYSRSSCGTEVHEMFEVYAAVEIKI